MNKKNQNQKEKLIRIKIKKIIKKTKKINSSSIFSNPP